MRTFIYGTPEHAAMIELHARIEAFRAKVQRIELPHTGADCATLQQRIKQFEADLTDLTKRAKDLAG